MTTATHLLRLLYSSSRRCTVMVVAGHINTVKDAGDVWTIVPVFPIISPMTKKMFIPRSTFSGT